MVIDELIVTLGLDSRQFTEGQRNALEAFKKGKEGAESFGKDVEAQGLKLSEVFSTVKKGLLGIVAGFAGNEAFQFIDRIASMDAATGRFAKTIGTTIPNLSVWQGMVRLIGGDAGSATSALSTLTNSLNNIRAGISRPDPALAQIAGLAGFDLMGRGSSDELLRKVQSYYENEIKTGRITPDVAATRMGQIPGMNQDVINVMLDDFKKLEATAKESGTATALSVAEGQRLVEIQNKMALSWENIGRVLMLLSGNSIIEFLERITKILVELSRGEIISSDSWLGKLLGLDKSRATKALAEGLGKQPNSGITSPAAAAIAKIESAGSGGYAAIGPPTSSGDRAYGKYQVMGANIPAWTLEATGRSMTPQEFLASPAAQDAVFEKKFGQLQQKYGNRAASAWFAGEKGMNDPNRRDSVGTSVQGYQDRFDQNMGAGAAATSRNNINNSKSSSSTTTNEVNIGHVSVNAPNATDAAGIAGDMSGALKKQAFIAGLNNATV